MWLFRTPQPKSSGSVKRVIEPPQGLLVVCGIVRFHDLMPMAKSKLQWLIVGGLISLTAACAAPRLDSSNLEKSAAKVRRSLDAADRERFDEALALVGEVHKGGVAGTERVDIDGMTGIELLVEAERIGLRREIAWAKQKMIYNQDVLGEKERLANLRVEEISIVEPGDGRVKVRMTLNNQTGEFLDNGFSRLRLDSEQGKALQTEEFVVFHPRLRPGEIRDIEAGVSAGFSRAIFSTPGARLTVEFTSLERDGEILAREPGAEALKDSQAAVAEAELELADLTQRLQAVN